MTFPTIPTAGASTLLESSQSTATTTHTFPNLSNLPNTPGALLMAVIVTYQGGSTNAEFSSWGGGFTEFVDQSANSTTVQSIGAAYKLNATGSESGTFTVTTVASTRSAMFLMEIPGAHSTEPPVATAKANGTTAAADPAALNPANWDVEDTLWIAVAANGETSLTGSFTGITAAPTNYGNYDDSGIIGGDVIGAIEGAVAFRQNATASEDVGTFTLDIGAAGNSALLIAVRPAPDVGGPTRQFNGTSDNITTAIGSLADLRDGNLTIAALVKVTDTGDAGIVEFHGTPALRTGLVHGSVTPPLGLQDDAGGAFVGPPPSLPVSIWAVGVITRASGTIRSHVYNFNTATWTHTAGGTVTGADDTLTSVILGGSVFGFFGGRIAMAAATAGTAHSDASIETLTTGLQAWVDLFTGSSAALWPLRQDSVATDIIDLTGGGANETAISGTTVSQDGPSPFDWELEPIVVTTPPIYY